MIIFKAISKKQDRNVRRVFTVPKDKESRWNVVSKEMNISGYIKHAKFLQHLRNYQLLKNVFITYR